eukprot:ANDGO_01051.mRNA.1 hypothetical protein
MVLTRKRSSAISHQSEIHLSGSETKENETMVPAERSAKRPPLVAAMLGEIDLEVDARCEALKSLANALKLAMRTELQLEFTRLPKRVRQMPLSEYLNENSMNGVLASARKQMPSYAPNAQLSSVSAAVPCTPSAFTPMSFRTPMRSTAPQPQSVAKAQTLLSTQKKIVVDVGNGKEVDLTDGVAQKKLSAKEKEAALQKLRELQDEMSALMEEMGNA